MKNDVTKNGNRPAIPTNNETIQQGLTKREKFAMAAMQGIMAVGDTAVGTKEAAFIAEQAVLVADALLEELDK